MVYRWAAVMDTNEPQRSLDALSRVEDRLPPRRDPPYAFGCRNGQGEVSEPGSPGTSISTGPDRANALSPPSFTAGRAFA